MHAYREAAHCWCCPCWPFCRPAAGVPAAVAASARWTWVARAARRNSYTPARPPPARRYRISRWLSTIPWWGLIAAVNAIPPANPAAPISLTRATSIPPGSRRAAWSILRTPAPRRWCSGWPTATTAGWARTRPPPVPPRSPPISSAGRPPRWIPPPPSSSARAGRWPPAAPGCCRLHWTRYSRGGWISPPPANCWTCCTSTAPTVTPTPPRCPRCHTSPVTVPNWPTPPCAAR